MSSPIILRRPITGAATVRQIRPLTHNMIELFIHVETTGFSFIPGQFISFVIPDTDPILTRSYSIVSTPDDLPEIRLWIKFSAHSLSETHLRALQRGDVVSFKGPYGRFRYLESGRPSLFIATSSGIAPFISMLSASRDNSEKKLLFGCRSEIDLFALPEIETLRIEKNLQTTIILSKPSSAWTGLQGRVTHVLETLPDDLSNTDVYICGSPQMVEDVRGVVSERSPKSILFEKF